MGLINPTANIKTSLEVHLRRPKIGLTFSYISHLTLGFYIVSPHFQAYLHSGIHLYIHTFYVRIYITVVIPVSIISAVLFIHTHFMYVL